MTLFTVNSEVILIRVCCMTWIYVHAVTVTQTVTSVSKCSYYNGARQNGIPYKKGNGIRKTTVAPTRILFGLGRQTSMPCNGSCHPRYITGNSVDIQASTCGRVMILIASYPSYFGYLRYFRAAASASGDLFSFWVGF